MARLLLLRVQVADHRTDTRQSTTAPMACKAKSIVPAAHPMGDVLPAQILHLSKKNTHPNNKEDKDGPHELD
jgi:hypothetical protein